MLSQINIRPVHRITRRSLIAMMAFVVVLAGFGSAAQADIDLRSFEDRRGRVERELERTQELLREVTSRSSDAKAPLVRELVARARMIQEQALGAMDSAKSSSMHDNNLSDRMADQHLRNSLSLTLRARDLAVRASRQLREDLGFEERARRALDRAKRQYDNLDPDSADSRLRDQAAHLIEQAELQWRDAKFEQALRLAQNAVNVLNTLSDRDDGSNSAPRLEQELRRVREMAQQAEEQGADANRLRAIERLIDQAARDLQEGRLRAAHQKLTTVRQQLRRLGNDAGSSDDDGARLAKALDRLDAQLERIGDRLDGRSARDLERLLSQAVQERDRARRALEAGNLDRARQHVRAAADLLARLQRRAGGRG